LIRSDFIEISIARGLREILSVGDLNVAFEEYLFILTIFYDLHERSLICKFLLGSVRRVFSSEKKHCIKPYTVYDIEKY